MRQFSIAMVLTMSFGTLVTCAVLSVLTISLYSGLANTRDLLEEKATSELASVEQNLRTLLNPIEKQVQFLSELIYRGEVDLNDPDSINQALLTSLSGMNENVGISIVYPDFSSRVATRFDKKIEYNPPVEPEGQDSLKEVLMTGVGHWGPLIYSPDVHETLMAFRQPIIRNEEFIGLVIGGIPVSEVRRAVQLDGLYKNDGRFVLYGRDHVLTYDGFQVHSDKLTYKGVTPKLSEIPDPVLSAIWTADREEFKWVKNKGAFQGHFIELNDETYQFIYTTIEGYTDKPLIVGYKVKFEDVAGALKRLAWAGFAGLGILIISCISAILIGRRIARSVHTISEASQKISKLNFNEVGTLPPSHLKELNEASEAYNTMLRSLSWFENYVPKSLVRKLMETGEAHSETRSVTVMFTDICEFTPFAEGMPSEEVANLLNQHFELVTACIEKEGGTVDKFIGDAVMAFWGAPEHQEDHAARACRAALAITETIERDNKKRRTEGRAPVYMRIGIHTGDLVVGNIGSSGRLNYTVVGDTVNIAQRIEQLGKNVQITPQPDVLALISMTTADQAGDTFPYQSVGVHRVKGRKEEVNICRLHQDETARPDEEEIGA